MWKHSVHPNIVPLLGVTLAPLQLISTWMAGGELSTYIGAHPCANRVGLVSPVSGMVEHELTLDQLSDVAVGLKFLHSRGIVHGDLKGVRRTGKCSPTQLIRVSAERPRG